MLSFSSPLLESSSNFIYFPVSTSSPQPRVRDSLWYFYCSHLVCLLLLWPAPAVGNQLPRCELPYGNPPWEWPLANSWWAVLGTCSKNPEQLNLANSMWGKGANKRICTYLSLEMRLTSYLVKGTDPEDKSNHIWFHYKQRLWDNKHKTLFCWCLHHPSIFSTGHSSYNIVILRCFFFFFISFMYFIFLCYLVINSTG